jgi:hypothetical protein
VLFSDAAVSDFIAQSFEPVWQSVRPVPIVRIDFGNGIVLARTLHGNILTSICLSDGLVVDALPGIYTRSIYVDQLRQILNAAKNIMASPPDNRPRLFQAYHLEQMDAKNRKPKARAGIKLPDLSKTVVIEAPIARVIKGANNLALQVQTKPQEGNPAEWKALLEDTQVNEGPRRLQIHELLVHTGLVSPDKLTKPIYKDVLHADLDDPYLGLGKTLFDSYPFAKEDRN